jgi:hypothetical protein
MAEKKKHHYVPRCYLEGFAHKCQVCAYDLIDRKPFESNIINICAENKFYYIPEGYRGKALEALSIEDDFFATTVEKDYSSFLATFSMFIESQLKEGNKTFVINRNSRLTASCFIYIQYVRTPRFRRLYERLSKDDRIRVTNAKGDDLNFVKLPVLFHAYGTYLNMNQLNKSSNILADRHLEVLYSTEGNFFSSDNPVTSIRLYKDKSFDFVDIADENSTVLFPVNKNIVIVFYPEKQEENSDYPRIIVANENLENQVNAFTVLNAERFVISYKDIHDIEKYKEFASFNK